MTYSRDSLQTIYSRVASDLEATKVKGSFKSVLATAIAGVAHMLHGHIDYFAKSMLPDSAEKDVLERWGNIYGVVRRLGTKARGQIKITASGAFHVDRGTRWHKDRVYYEAVRELASEEAGEFTVEVVCQGVGIVGNLSSGVTLSSEFTLVNLKPEAEVIKIDGGSEQEEFDATFRDRLLRIIRSTPQGGCKADYINWIEAVPNVRKAWVRSAPNGPGTVHVTFVEYGSDLQSQATIEAIGKRLVKLAPVTAQIELIPLKKRNLANEIRYSLTPESKALREDANAAIAKLVKSIEPKGFEDIEGNVSDGVIYLSKISEAISQVPGEITHRILRPSQDIILGTNEVPVYEG